MRKSPAAATASLARPSAATRPSRVSRSTSPSAALVRPRPPPATSRAAAATTAAKAARPVAARTLSRSVIGTTSTSRPLKSLARRPRSTSNSSDPAIPGHAPGRPVAKSPRLRIVKAAARLTRPLGTSRQKKTPTSQRRPPPMFWLELELELGLGLKPGLERRPRFKKRATMTRQSTRSWTRFDDPTTRRPSQPVRGQPIWIVKVSSTCVLDSVASKATMDGIGFDFVVLNLNSWFWRCWEGE